MVDGIRFVLCSGGSAYDVGNLDCRNLDVRETSDGLKISKSLSRWYYGNNFFNFKKIADLENCFKELSDGLSIDYDILLKSEITRLDVNCNFIIEKPISTFLQSLSLYAGKQVKSSFNLESATYGLGSEKQLIFYDKIKDLNSQLRKSKQRRETDETKYISTILQSFGKDNFLRIEQRYLSKRMIETTFGKLILKDLLSVKVWERIKAKFLEKYESIGISENPNIAPTSKNLRNYILKVGLETVGSEMIEQLIADEPNAQKRYTMRKQIYGIHEVIKQDEPKTHEPLKQKIKRGVEQTFIKFIGIQRNAITTLRT